MGFFSENLFARFVRQIARRAGFLPLRQARRRGRARLSAFPLTLCLLSAPAAAAADERGRQAPHKQIAAGPARPEKSPIEKKALAEKAPPKALAAAGGEERPKWSLNLAGSFAEDFLMEKVMVFSAKWGVGYSVSDRLSLAAEGGYLLPLDFVSDPGLYEWTDAAVSGNMSFDSLKGFLGFDKWAAEAGIGLPPPKIYRRSGKIVSLFGGASHSRQLIPKKLALSLKHSVYSGYYRYRASRSGRNHPLAVFEHSAGLSFLPLKALKISGAVSFQGYVYRYDSNTDPDVYEGKWRFNGNQSARLGISYNLWPKYKLGLSAGAAWKAPIISPVLRGYPPIDNLRYFSYSFGLRGALSGGRAAP